jgi:hypothetical protein
MKTKEQELKKEIETKELAILSVKRYRGGLKEHEKYLFNSLTKKYRNKLGKLKRGSYFINSNSQWERVK